MPIGQIKITLYSCERLRVKEFPRRINGEDSVLLSSFISYFDRVRNGVVPDYLILSVDNSGSMDTLDIQEGYSMAQDNFLDWIESNYPGTTTFERYPAYCWGDCERWVDEIKTAIEEEVLE